MSRFTFAGWGLRIKLGSYRNLKSARMAAPVWLGFSVQIRMAELSMY